MDENENSSLNNIDNPPNLHHHQNSTDNLTLLEKRLEKLSELFFSSLDEVQRHAPLSRLENEDSMENSRQNLERMKVEKIVDYEDKKLLYGQNLNKRAGDIQNTFAEISHLLDDLQSNEDFKNTDEMLRENLSKLRTWNEQKFRSINDKIRQMNGIVESIQMQASSLDNVEI